MTLPQPPYSIDTSSLTGNEMIPSALMTTTLTTKLVSNSNPPPQSQQKAQNSTTSNYISGDDDCFWCFLGTGHESNRNCCGCSDSENETPETCDKCCNKRCGKIFKRVLFSL